jgi:thymidylate synthase
VNVRDTDAEHGASSSLLLETNSIGEAWILIALHIMERGKPSTYDGKKIAELMMITLEIASPKSHDAIIAQFADPERLAWMHDNFNDHAIVSELGGADSYATRLRDYEHAGRDQIAWVVERLRLDRHSRSATITTLQPLSDTTYIPCVSLLDFFIEDDALALSVYAHSIDFGAKGYANLTQLAMLQEEVAMALSLPLGRLVMIIKSAHVYQSDDDYMKGVLTALSS